MHVLTGYQSTHCATSNAIYSCYFFFLSRVISTQFTKNNFFLRFFASNCSLRSSSILSEFGYSPPFSFLIFFLKHYQEVNREVEENDISNGVAYQTSNTDHKALSDVDVPNQKSNGLCGSKRPSDSVELSDSKKCRTVNTDSSDVEHVAVDGSASPCSMSENDQPDKQGNGDATIDEFHCTACDKVANEVHTHPLLKVIICRNCKYSLEEKMKETVCIVDMMFYMNTRFVFSNIMLLQTCKYQEFILLMSGS